MGSSSYWRQSGPVGPVRLNNSFGVCDVRRILFRGKVIGGMSKATNRRAEENTQEEGGAQARGRQRLKRSLGQLYTYTYLMRCGNALWAQ
jgi:hypothetical protein